MKHYVKWLLGAAVAAGLGSGSIGWALAQGNESSKAGSGKTFADVAGHWGEASIGTAVAKGYVDGYEDGSFKPDREVTRAEFVKLALTALALPVSASSSGSNWYVPYIDAAVQHGLHDWSDFTSGDWNTPMTRYEMSRMAVRAAGQKTDDEKQWMYLATKAGLIQGVDDTGSLDAEGTTTRAQAVTIIERILDVKAGKTLPADKHAVSRAEVVWHKTNIFTVMPEYTVNGDVVKGREWDVNKLTVSFPGEWEAVIDGLFAVDLSDPNDPFLAEIPAPLEKLTWWSRVDRKDYPVKDYPDSYLVFLKYHMVYDNSERFAPYLDVGLEYYSNVPESGLNKVKPINAGIDKSIILIPKGLQCEPDIIFYASPVASGMIPKKVLFGITLNQE